MPEILQVTTIERHLFGPDAIPWSEIRLATNLAELQARYKFSQAAWGVDPVSNALRQLTCVSGEALIEGRSSTIEQLILEPNAIQFQIATDSGRSEGLFKDLVEFLKEIDPDRGFSTDREYAKTYQTIVVARLAVAPDSLFSERLQHFMREVAVPTLKASGPGVEVFLEHLGWRVTYAPSAPEFLLLPKALTIEPRAGSKASEMLYYTQSPTPFGVHKRLLEQFESLVGTPS